MPNEHDPLPLSPEESQRLRELREALQSEFHDSQKDNPNRTPLNDLEDIKEDFLNAIKYVVNHSDSHALRAKVAMWGYDKLLDQGKAKTDPIHKLLEEMESARAN